MISNLQFRFRDLFFDSHELFSRFSFRNPPSAIRIRRRWLQWQPNWHVATWTRIQKRLQYRTCVFGRGKDRQDQYYGLLIILKGRNSAVARLYHMLCWSCQYENDPRSLPKNICIVARSFRQSIRRNSRKHSHAATSLYDKRVPSYMVSQGQFMIYPG